MTTPQPKVTTFGILEAFGENGLAFSRFTIDADGFQGSQGMLIISAVIWRLQIELEKEKKAFEKMPLSARNTNYWLVGPSEELEGEAK